LRSTGKTELTDWQKVRGILFRVFEFALTIGFADDGFCPLCRILFDIIIEPKKMRYSFTATYGLFSKKFQKYLVRSFSCRTFAADFAPKRGVDKENVL